MITWDISSLLIGKVAGSSSIYINIHRKPPNIRPGLIFVRKHFLVQAYTWGRGGDTRFAYIRTRFCVCNINHLLDVISL